jgi:peptidoglycan L-alanyl-D-glutamate endopeptidase CwlK
VPWIKGKPVWDWDGIYLIASAVTAAAQEGNVQLRWGGCWQCVNDLPGAPENWVAQYVKRKRKAGKRAFNDGPHWELFK